MATCIWPDMPRLIRHNLSLSTSSRSRKIVQHCLTLVSVSRTSVLPNGKMSLKSDDPTIMTIQKQVSKSEPGTSRGSHRVVQRSLGDQLICWLCIAKKPAFMLIHEFMQEQWTQLFIYLNNGYLHQTMELPTVQEKSKQIFFALLKAHQYKFRDKQDCSATLTMPKVKNIITMMTWIHLIVRIHISHLVSLFQMRN